jgi:hypothetical protein
LQEAFPCSGLQEAFPCSRLQEAFPCSQRVLECLYGPVLVHVDVPACLGLASGARCLTLSTWISLDLLSSVGSMAGPPCGVYYGDAHFATLSSILLDLQPSPVCLYILSSAPISSTSGVQCFILSTPILLDAQPHYKDFSSPTSSILLDAQPYYEYLFASSLGMFNSICLRHLLMFSMLL